MIKDQCPESSYFYDWSGLDLKDRASLEERLAKLKDLIELFCTPQTNTVCQYISTKEDETEPSLYEGFNVKIVYPSKIDCSEDQLAKEINDAWPIINRLWLKNCNLLKPKLPEQLDIWKAFINNHSIEFPYFANLVQIMIATSPNTSDLERGYTQLQMIAEKRRNHLKIENMETLFILANIKDKVLV